MEETTLVSFVQSVSSLFFLLGICYALCVCNHVSIMYPCTHVAVYCRYVLYVFMHACMPECTYMYICVRAE